MSFATTELEDFTLVHVATRGDSDAAAAALSAALGVPVAANPGSASDREDGLTVLWAGPGRWLVRAPVPGFRVDAIDGCVATDLTDSRRVFRLSGSAAALFLSAACPLDLRQRAMPAGSSALSHFDRFPILLHRRGGAEFDLYVERSYAPALGLTGA